MSKMTYQPHKTRENEPRISGSVRTKNGQAVLRRRRAKGRKRLAA